jgi:hypothetical protein
MNVHNRVSIIWNTSTCNANRATNVQLSACHVPFREVTLVYWYQIVNRISLLMRRLNVNISKEILKYISRTAFSKANLTSTWKHHQASCFIYGSLYSVYCWHAQGQQCTESYVPFRLSEWRGYLCFAYGAELFVLVLTEIQQGSCRIWSSHNGCYEKFYIVGYIVVQSIEEQPTFRRNMSFLSSGLKNESSKKPVELATSFTLLSFLAYSSTLKMEAISSSDGLHGVIFQIILTWTSLSLKVLVVLLRPSRQMLGCLKQDVDCLFPYPFQFAVYSYPLIQRCIFWVPDMSVRIYQH